VDREASTRTLRSFVPSQVADRLAASPGKAIGQEELEVTVLFSDIRGFSTLAEELPAREIASILATHLTAMAEVVRDHMGTIDKFAGDAVMAVFGAPDPIPDHAERALRCAVAMQARQTELNGQALPDGLPPLGMGIGVNTGTVIAGTVGGGGRLEYTVVGDAVNVAQRLQSEAAPGEILATDSTVHAAPQVRVESLGPLTVKGRREPVQTFRVVESS
jgi:class 3 adenylate cyclase